MKDALYCLIILAVLLVAMVWHFSDLARSKELEARIEKLELMRSWSCTIRPDGLQVCTLIGGVAR